MTPVGEQLRSARDWILEDLAVSGSRPRAVWGISYIITSELVIAVHRGAHDVPGNYCGLRNDEVVYLTLIDVADESDARQELQPDETTAAWPRTALIGHVQHSMAASWRRPPIVVKQNVSSSLASTYKSTYSTLHIVNKAAHSSPNPVVPQMSPLFILSALLRLYFTSDFSSAVTLSFGGAAPPVVGNPMKILNES